MHSTDSAKELSLSAQAGAPLLWLCGDYALYFAHREFPGYSYYIMIEYDVHFTKDGSKFLDHLVKMLLSDPTVDAVGLNYKKYATGISPDQARDPQYWVHLYPATLAFNDVHYMYFPFIAVSERGVAHPLKGRQEEAARGTQPEHVVHCEAFVPSYLVAGGFRCADLNEVLRGSYTVDGVSLQGRDPSGLPLHSSAVADDSVEILHAVYGDREFLQRNLRRSMNDSNALSSFVEMLRSKLCNRIPGDLRAEYERLAHDRVEMLARPLQLTGS